MQLGGLVTRTPQKEVNMSDFTAYFYIGLGVLVAVLYPVIVGWFRREFRFTKGIPPWLVKYVALLVFCAFTAFVVLVIYRANHPDTELRFYTAVMLGFGWESSVEKIWNGLAAKTASAKSSAGSTSPSEHGAGPDRTRT
jgi:Na+/melibiose symporter-like transporter